MRCAALVRPWCRGVFPISAVDPTNKNIRYVAASTGGVWKTTNAGTTWKPIFDGEGSFSIGSVTLDPKNPLTVWVGSGENNSQRAVQYGDGVYKSLDGGTTWKNMGLKTSEHISTIAVDPRDSNVVWVAAQGPLWKDGGERGAARDDATAARPGPRRSKLRSTPA